MKYEAFRIHFVLAVGVFNTAVCIASRPVQQPHIIYILADDLGYGDVGFMGQQKILTPSLDQMAREGLVFSRHYAAPVCAPARASLMTGMSQAVGFIKGNPAHSWQQENLRDRDVTIAEKLKEAGYNTACFGKWGLGPQGKSGYPLNQGFDEFVGYDTHRAAHNYYPEKLCANQGLLMLQQDGDKRTYSHDVFTEKALSYLAQKHDDPFFLYLAYTIPHSPFNPPDMTPYQDKDWDPEYKKYAAMITRMDRDIGKLLNLLKIRGLAKNTLVMFSSDNGPQSSYNTGVNPMTEFFNSNGPFRGIKRDLFEGGVRVPMVAWWPGHIKPGQTDHASGFQDVMPTLCELVGVNPPQGLDGISFLPTLLGDPASQKKHDYLYWEFIRGNEGGRQGLLDVQRNIKAIRHGRFEALRIYDLNVDLGEKNSIVSIRPELVQALSQKMADIRSSSEFWPLHLHDKGWLPID